VDSQAEACGLLKKGTDGSVHGHLGTSDYYLTDGDRVASVPFFHSGSFQKLTRKLLLLMVVGVRRDGILRRLGKPASKNLWHASTRVNNPRPV